MKVDNILMMSCITVHTMKAEKEDLEQYSL